MLTAHLFGFIMAHSTLFSHFWHYYFVPNSPLPWWMGAVWGNVLAIIPSIPVLTLLGAVGYYFHKKALDPLHARIAHEQRISAQRHAEHVKILGSLLDALDPQDQSSPLGEIRDMLDPDTPSGIGVLREDLQLLTKGKMND